MKNAAFSLSPTPIVIDPYDRIVQQAYNKLPPNLQKNIDVIKLEATCPGEKAAWVSNEDLLKGRKGRERTIHLCLNKIRDQFKKIYGDPFKLTDPSKQKEMEEVIVTYLRDVILPHEEKHIQQEMQGEGDFGSMAEPEAERAENYQSLKQMGITLKSSSLITARLDAVAEVLESNGLKREAFTLDLISNTIEQK